MSCSRKVQTRRTCFIVGCLATVAMMSTMYVIQDLVNRKCSFETSQQLIVDLCALYRDKQISGNMCHTLCEESRFTINSCMNNHVGKNVLFLECDGCDVDNHVTNVVLKSQLNIKYMLNLKTSMFNDSTESFLSIANRVVKGINDKTEMYFGKRYDLSLNEFLSMIWKNDFESHVNSGSHNDTGRIALMSVYSLGMQLEYLSLLAMEDVQKLPKLYGTCGYAYFVENTPSLSKLNYILFQGKMPEILKADFNFKGWRERALVAIQLLDLIEKFEDDFEATVQMCDLKTHNIGVNSKNQVTVLDSDSLHFEGIYPELLTRGCYSDDDCRVLDCHTSCNMTSHTCLTKRKNNNLQTLCKNIFVSGVETLGLLRFPPSSVRAELFTAVHDCADEMTYIGGKHRQRRVFVQLLHRLRTLLERSLN